MAAGTSRHRSPPVAIHDCDNPARASPSSSTPLARRCEKQQDNHAQGHWPLSSPTTTTRQRRHHHYHRQTIYHRLFVGSLCFATINIAFVHYTFRNYETSAGTHDDNDRDDGAPLSIAKRSRFGPLAASPAFLRKSRKAALEFFASAGRRQQKRQQDHGSNNNHNMRSSSTSTNHAPSALASSVASRGRHHRVVYLEPGAWEGESSKTSSNDDDDDDDKVQPMSDGRYLPDYEDDTSWRYFDYREALTDGECVAMSEWQTTQYPACNSMHEAYAAPQDLSFIAQGTVSVVFGVDRTYDGANSWILKTNMYYKDFKAKYFEGRRVDAMVQERLTASPYVASIFGFCGVSVLAPFANGGSLHDLINSIRHGGQEPSTLDKLKIAYQVATSVADLHDMDKNGIASFAHNDIDVTQHIFFNGTFQLNDFNYGKLLLRPRPTKTENSNSSPARPCKVRETGIGRYKYRPPEELAANRQAIALDRGDDYSMCNELYMILTNQWLFEGMDKSVATPLIARGERSPIPPRILQSPDPAVQAVLQALRMCWVNDPDKRFTSREVSDFLRSQLNELLLGDNDKDGVIRVSLPPILHGIKSDYSANW